VVPLPLAVASYTRAMRLKCAAFMGVIAFSLVSCNARRHPAVSVPQPNAPQQREAFLDLEPGWRIRTVTPQFKSGGYKASFSQATSEGNNVTLTLDDDFIGYETAYYLVKRRGRKGVRIRFDAADFTRDGSTSARERPAVSLFQPIERFRHIRLIYLERASVAEHDLALVGSNTPEALETLTAAVRNEPDQACIAAQASACSWVPVGIAVRAEKLTDQGGAPVWAPVR
jgi:hypothetical protein